MKGCLGEGDDYIIVVLCLLKAKDYCERVPPSTASPYHAAIGWQPLDDSVIEKKIWRWKILLALTRNCLRRSFKLFVPQVSSCCWAIVMPNSLGYCENQLRYFIENNFASLKHCKHEDQRREAMQSSRKNIVWPSLSFLSPDSITYYLTSTTQLLQAYFFTCQGNIITLWQLRVMLWMWEWNSTCVPSVRSGSVPLGSHLSTSQSFCTLYMHAFAPSFPWQMQSLVLQGEQAPSPRLERETARGGCQKKVKGFPGLWPQPALGVPWDGDEAKPQSGVIAHS